MKLFSLTDDSKQVASTFYNNLDVLRGIIFSLHLNTFGGLASDLALC